MDTSAARPISLPQLEHNGKRLASSRPDPEDPTRTKSNGVHHHHHHNHNHNHNNNNNNNHHHSHHHHSHNHTRGHSRSNSNPDTAHATSSAQDIFIHGNSSGLSLREQQQLHDKAAYGSTSTSTSTSTSPPKSSPASLSLNISPPRETLSFLTVDPSSQREYGSGSNNSLHVSNHDSLGRSRSHSHSHSQPGSRSASRRASFNLATGSLNFNPSTSTSQSSPSSPSYSTLAVARARAAAAAAAAAAEGGQGADIHAIGGGVLGGSGGLGGITEESGVFPGAPASLPFSSSSSTTFSSSHSAAADTAASGSNAGSTSSIANYDSPMFDSKPNASSSTSLLSDESGSGLSSALPTHVQDNANAEREVSMILDDFLYLGGELVEEEQISELENLGIKRVLNMAVNCNDELWIQRFGNDGYLKVGLLDHVDQDLQGGLDEAIKFIASSQAPVYVHCQAGKSRSVATVIGYLIQERRWPLKKAYDHVVERRRIMSPNIGFVSQLVMLEERVLGSDKASGLVTVDEEANPASRTTVMPWMTS